MKLNVLTALCLFIGSYVIGSKDLCDVRVWYQILIADDIFIRDLNRDQIKLKNNIESLVLKSTETETANMIDCYIIEMYNEMLQDKYDYVYKQNIKGNIKQAEEQMVSGKSTEQNLVQNEISHNKKVASVAGRVSAEKGADLREKVNERTHPKKEAQPQAGEHDKLEDANEVDETEFSEDEEIVFSEDENYILGVENDAKESVLRLRKHTVKEPLISNEKETSHVFITEGGSETLNIMASGEPSKPKADTLINGVTTEKRSTNGIPFGVCRKSHSTIIDIFDALYCENSTGESNKSSLKIQSDYILSLSNCHNGLFCSRQCFYVFSPTYCIVGYLSLIKTYDVDTGRGKITQSDQGPMPPDSVTGQLDSSTVRTDIAGQEEDKQKLNKSMPEARDGDQPKVRNVQTDIDARELNIQKERHFSNSKERLSMEEIEHHMNKKTSEYSGKLQNLELMILRLENQLLTETMNKQNHSSTITKLENQILRLENTLLNMNKKYNDLLSESQVMKARQVTYLELEQERKNDKYLALEDKSVQNFEMITHHQAKIKELTEKLENQTEIISNLKLKSEYIENHNRMLHQLIMNQAVFMSQVRQRVQDLSDQSSKQRDETSILKQKLGMSLARNKLMELERKMSTSIMSEHLMEELDMLVSDTKIPDLDKKISTQHELQGNIKNYDDDADIHFRDFLNREGFREQIVNWCPSENYSAAVCMSNTLVNSQCPPYNSLIWKMCIGTITQQNTLKVSDSLDTNEGQIVNRHSITNDGIDTGLQERPMEVLESDRSVSEHCDRDKKLCANSKKIGAAKHDDEQNLRKPLNSNAESINMIKIKDDAEKNKLSTKVENQPEINNEKSFKGEHKYVESQELVQNANQQENIDKNTQELEVQEQQEPIDINVKRPEVLQQQEVTADRNVKQPDVLEKQEQIAKNVKPLEVLEQQEPVDRNIKRLEILEQQNSAEQKPKSSDVIEQQEIVEKYARSHTVEIQEHIDKNTKGADVLEQQKLTDEDKVSDVLDQQNTVEKNSKQSDFVELQKPVNKNAKGTDVVELHDQQKLEEIDKKSDVLEQQTTTEKNVNMSDFQGQQETADKSIKISNVLEQTKEDAHKNDYDSHTQQKPNEQEQDSSKEASVSKEGTAAKDKLKKERKTPIYMSDKNQREPKDCYDYYILGNYKDGTYKIKPTGSSELIPVFCDMKRGGWTMIQKRQDGSTNFFRKWEDYRKGFGGLYGEHWIGNENIHHLTNQDYYSLRVDLRDWDKEWHYAIYQYFLVESEDKGYRLNIDGYSGDAGDGLGKHDGSQFSTMDVDNDKVIKEFGGSCANRFHGAGWYYKCYSSNLNGRYYTSGKIPDKQHDGVTWKPWKGPNYSLRVTEMKIRPASVKDGK